MRYFKFEQSLKLRWCQAWELFVDHKFEGPQQRLKFKPTAYVVVA